MTGFMIIDLKPKDGGELTNLVSYADSQTETHKKIDKKKIMMGNNQQDWLSNYQL